MPFDAQRLAADYHVVGFRECASEVARYLVTMEGMDIQDPLRLRLMSHLQCFVAQRELQLKSNNSGLANISNDPLSPTSATVNPISPNMGQSPSTTNSSQWSTPTSSYQHGSNGYQMMPTTYQQNAYASQPATAQGYVPNLPLPLAQQYDQYGNPRSSQGDNNNSYGNPTETSTRSGVTTRSQANNTTSVVSSTGNNSSTAIPSNENSNVENKDQSNKSSSAGPTYTDLSSSVAPVSSTSSPITAVSASEVGINNNRLQNNYNIYGHIHYPSVDPATASSYGGYPHHHHGYNLHLDPSRGYNGVQGNVVGGGNAKPYRPWGAEMAY